MAESYYNLRPAILGFSHCRFGGKKNNPIMYVPDNSVESTLMAKRAVEYDLGSAYCTDKCEIRLTANVCFSMSACLRSSGAKSRQMCIEGTPLTVIGNRFEG